MSGLPTSCTKKRFNHSFFQTGRSKGRFAELAASEAIAEWIMGAVDGALSELPPRQRRRVIGILGGAHRHRLEAEEVLE